MAAQTRQSSGAHLASRFGALALAAGVMSKITCKADRDAPIELVREVVRREIRRKKRKSGTPLGTVLLRDRRAIRTGSIRHTVAMMSDRDPR